MRLANDRPLVWTAATKRIRKTKRIRLLADALVFLALALRSALGLLTGRSSLLGLRFLGGAILTGVVCRIIVAHKCMFYVFNLTG